MLESRYQSDLNGSLKSSQFPITSLKSSFPGQLLMFENFSANSEKFSSFKTFGTSSKAVSYLYR